MVRITIASALFFFLLRLTSPSHGPTSLQLVRRPCQDEFAQATCTAELRVRERASQWVGGKVGEAKKCESKKAFSFGLIVVLLLLEKNPFSWHTHLQQPTLPTIHQPPSLAHPADSMDREKVQEKNKIYWKREKGWRVAMGIPQERLEASQEIIPCVK